MAGKYARGGFSILALAVALAGSAGPASAERYLFDILFGNRAPRERAQPPQPVQQPHPGASVQRGQAPQRNVTPQAPAPRISAPTFYNFNADPLVRVDFEALSRLAGGETSQATDDASPFLKALSGLSGFELFAERKIAEALVEHYSKYPEFIWIDGNGPSVRADEVLAVLGNAAEFGLSETDYVVNVPLSSNAPSTDGRMKALIRFEMALSARALRYARDARLGRVDPNKLSGYHDFKPKPFDDVSVLQALARTPKPTAYLASMHPQNELYSALHRELKALRSAPEQEIVVDPGTFVRPGGSHPEFAKILHIIEHNADDDFKAEHGTLLAAHAGSETYAPELVPVIKAAQKKHELTPDGIVGARTVGALAGDSKALRIEKVLLAMERLRWHPSYLGSTRVMLNVPSFTASYIEGGKEKLGMRTVVGRPTTQTNFFHDEIEYVEFNPYWGVPRSILVNEMLPKLRRDPSYLDRAGYEVLDSRGRRISSSAVNWAAYGTNVPVGVRQPPGPRNALGELKIMFPNKHDIYMHDTPEKSLFSRDARAFSHGCVRLQDPRAMAAAVLGISREDVGSRIGQGRNARANLPKKIPVYVAYFTAWPEPSGTGVTYHPDIYERDANLMKALEKIAEVRGPGS